MEDEKAQRYLDIGWLPLESNPEVITKFAQKLGMSKIWQFHDVYGLDPDLLAMVPQPVAAVLLLFPDSSDNYIKYLSEKEAKLSESGQQTGENVYFMKQTIRNACGTIGLLHSIANNTDKIDLSDHLEDFMKNTKDMSPEDRARYLENDQDIRINHASCAQEGQTEAPRVDDDVNFHFVAFVHKDGDLYELDGRKPCPVKHGKTTPESLLPDTCEVIKQFMARDPTELHFTVVALGPSFM